MTPWSLYLHIPFCRLRCAYCDFNTYAGLDDLILPYAWALAREIRLVGAAAAQRLPVHTLFFGGGTPSLLPLEAYQAVFAALRDSFDLAPDCEITLEANPGTVDEAYLAGLRTLGVNRLSFGVQSANPWELKLLDRLHSFDDVIQAVRLARAAGFDAQSRGLSLDLIFALPHQTLSDWQATLERTLALEPDHLSLYALSLEHGTPLRAWVHRGLLPMPDPDRAAEMYEWASEQLTYHGYGQYEISNWAREPGLNFATRLASSFKPPASVIEPPALACRHNLQYWRNQPYLGLGAGAHGSVPASWIEQSQQGWRYANVLAPAAYIARLSDEAEPRQFPFSPAVVEATRISREEEMAETVMLGMRLVREGIREANFCARFGLGLEAVFSRQLRRLQQLGLIEWDTTGARLTPPGRLLGNRVFREFV